MTDPRPRVLYNAPVLAYDYEPDGEPIWPCPDCLPWHVEVVREPPDGVVLVRVWHAVDCHVWTGNESSEGSDGTH